MDYQLRMATMADVPDLAVLIGESARALGAPDYAPEQIEGALQGAFGVDSQLIVDQGYFLLVTPEGALAAGGGVSFRRTLFGGDTATVRDASMLDPANDAARIRAFFVHPAHARRGLGSRILDACEAHARAQGFTRFQLMATLAGQRLYARHGYQAGEPIDHPLPNGTRIRFVPMSKSDGPTAGPAG
jgi:GNAT superfamily N-acetyltransferase